MEAASPSRPPLRVGEFLDVIMEGVLKRLTIFVDKYFLFLPFKGG